MQEIIAHIEKTVHAVQPFSQEKFVKMLDIDSHLHWKTNFPVAVVHHKDRMGEETVACFEKEGLLDTEGYTRELYAYEELNEFAAKLPEAFKRVSSLCLAKESDSCRYEPKRSGDKWKKLVDNGTFKATIELSVYDKTAEKCKVEAELRDLMRSSKEIPSLKAIGFVWVAVLPKIKKIDEILKHYFDNCYLRIENESEHVYIGWHEQLGNINMRYFVCSPNKEKK